MAHNRSTAVGVATISARWLLRAGLLLTTLGMAAALVSLVWGVARLQVPYVVASLLGGFVISQLMGSMTARRRARALRAATTEAPDGEGRLHLDLNRTLVVATLDTAVVARESDLTPDQAARLWGAIRVDEDQQTFRLLIAPPPDGAVAAVHLLRSFYPVSVEVWEAPTALTGQPANPQLRALVDESLSAWPRRDRGAEGAN